MGLIYLDPPFNSAANYDVLFKAPDGKSSEGQLEVFEDTWHWGARAREEVLTNTTHTDAERLPPLGRSEGFRRTPREKRGTPADQRPLFE